MTMRSGILAGVCLAWKRQVGRVLSGRPAHLPTLERTALDKGTGVRTYGHTQTSCVRNTCTNRQVAVSIHFSIYMCVHEHAQGAIPSKVRLQTK